MLNERLLDALNNQMKSEFESSHTYLAMAGYCASIDFEGFADFFKAQANEERVHAMKIYNFIDDKGGRVKIKETKEPANDFASVVDVFEKAYEHEQSITQRIYQLSDMAIEEKEHSTISFLKWFIDEQVEEEKTFDSLVKKIKLADNNNAALLMLDADLGKRESIPAE